MVAKRRKNFFPAFILILLLWTTFALMIIFVEPELIKNILIPGFYLPFFINLFFALFLTSAIIFANSRKGLLFSFAISLFLILRLFELGNILNVILIISLVFALERYFTREN